MKAGDRVGSPKSPRGRVSRRGVTADTALRLARYFGTTPEFWLNLQQAHDLSKVEVEHGAEIERFVEQRRLEVGQQ